MKKQRVGVKIKYAGSCMDVAKNGLCKFNELEHTCGHTPQEILFAPSEKPDIEELFGLRVLEDSRLDPGFVRITTVPLSVAEELAIDSAFFGQQVSLAASRL